MKPWMLVLPIILTISACAKPTTMMPHYSKQEVHQETQIQKDLANKGKRLSKAPFTEKEIKKMQQRLTRHALRVREAGMNLCRNMGRNPNSCVYNFALRKDKNMNAYADGNNIFVTPPMMRFAEDDDLLGIVLSHEYAHNLMGHVDSKKQNVMAGMLLGAVVDAFAKTNGQFAKLGASGAGRAFSPQFEEEADYVGLYIMALAGYDINKASQLWREMTVADPRGAFMTGTHPSNPQRYVLLDRTKGEIVNKVRSNILLVPNFIPQ